MNNPLINTNIKPIDIKLLVLVVFSFLLVLFSGLPPKAEAGTAILKIDPPQGTFYVDSSFDVSIILDTGGETINAVEAELFFPPNILQVTTPTAAQSFIAIWTSPPTFSNKDGYVRFQGGVPSPGLKTSQGVLSTVTFRATQPGKVVLELKNSRVLLADGSGRDILGTTLGARYTISVAPPQGPFVYSSTHPEYTKWYRDKNVNFAWDKDADVSEFSWSFDKVPNGVPDTVADGDKASVSFENIEDGLWYFHIRANKGNVWGGVTTFPVKIDTMSPAMFTVELDPKNRVTEGTRTLAMFRTTDTLSGIDRYEVKVVNISGAEKTEGSTFFIEGESPYTLPELSVGNYDIIVRAYDIAGNFQESSVKLEVVKPVTPFFLTRGLKLGFLLAPWPIAIIVSFVITIIVGFFVFKFWRKHRHIKKKGHELKSRIGEELASIQKKMAEDLAARKELSESLGRIKNLSKTSLGSSDADASEDKKGGGENKPQLS